MSFDRILFVELIGGIGDLVHAIPAMHALATTEVPLAVGSDCGIVTNDIGALAAGMRALLADRALATEMGKAARRVAAERFGIERFVRDWERAFALAMEVAT